jgi:carboxyl-terminal processing protease
MKNKRKILLPIILILSFGLFYFVGYLVGHENLKFEKGYIPQVVNKDLGKPKSLDFSLFWDVWNQVETKYSGNIDQPKMLEGAIDGMIASLNDPYTVFMEPSQSQSFLQDLSGSFSGIGAEVTIKNNQLTVVSALSGSPAEKAGLQSGDVIKKINGIDTSNMTLEDAVNKIHGASGTTVKLIITRGTSTLEKDIVREVINVPSVTYNIKNNIATITISQFGDDTKGLFDKAVTDIQAKKPAGIIVDLRDNPGGYLQTSVDIASAFIKSGVIVAEVDKGGKKIDYKSNGDGRLANYRLEVLVNSGSASASEIFAGAIQDHKQGTIIGEKTFGKGCVQELESLPGGAYLRLTIANWFTPNGKNITGSGISPDIQVNLSQSDSDQGKDPQMDRAIQEINK